MSPYYIGPHQMCKKKTIIDQCLNMKKVHINNHRKQDAVDQVLIGKTIYVDKVIQRLNLDRMSRTSPTVIIVVNCSY